MRSTTQAQETMLVDLWRKPPTGTNARDYPTHWIEVPHGTPLEGHPARDGESADGQTWTVREIITVRVPASWEWDINDDGEVAALYNGRSLVRFREVDSVRGRRMLADWSLPGQSPDERERQRTFVAVVSRRDV